MTRYRFADFALSPRRRVLTRSGRELPLIPRYFDLLVFLVERRAEAVHRRDIFERVWADVVVSDSALSQAVRTLRRTLGDDSRDPIYIRTVSRHGYRFVGEVTEENDEDRTPDEPIAPSTALREPVAVDLFEPLLVRLVTPARHPAREEELREAAEELHALGAEEALARLGTRPGHAQARALLRDTRWDVAGAGPVPLLGSPGALPAILWLVFLRLRRMARLAAARTWWSALGGGIAGCAAGVLGGAILVIAPGSQASPAVAAALGVVGGVCGALGAAGVGAGLSVAEATARSGRALWLVAGGALGGGIVGWTTEWLGHSILLALVGVQVPVTGGPEGVAIGAASGLAYGWATWRASGGLATPRGRSRVGAVLIMGLMCAAAALALVLAGSPLVGGTVHALAKASIGSQAALTPIGRLVGEPDFGPLARAAIGTGEGLVFGLGLAFGLTRRPV